MMTVRGPRTTTVIVLMLTILFPVLAISSPLVTPVDPPELGCAAAVLIDPETRQVLYEHNADERRPVASLTKMMTALLVAESGDLDRTITVSAKAAAVGQTTMNLSAGEEIKLRHLLAGIMLPSANDGATACAEAVSGSVEAFVELMNERATELGMHGTSFTNPHGLHEDGHYSTARDMAILALHVMGRPEIRPIVREAEMIVPWPGKPYERTLANRNRLLTQWDAADGIKTGYTRQAGNCLAASAYVDGWRLIGVVLGAEDTRADARTLLEWGFNSFYKVALVSKDLTKANLVVDRGTQDTVDARAAADVIAVLPRNQKPDDPLLVDTSCEAPVAVGDVVGQLSVVMPDGSREYVDLIAEESVTLSTWARLIDETWSFAAITVLLALAVGVVVHGTAAEAISARGAG